MSYFTFCKYAAETALAIKARNLIAVPTSYGIDDEARQPLTLGDIQRYREQVNQHFTSQLVGPGPEPTFTPEVMGAVSRLNPYTAGQPVNMYSTGGRLGFETTQKFAMLQKLALRLREVAPGLSLPEPELAPGNSEEESLELALRAYDELLPEDPDALLNPVAENIVTSTAKKNVIKGVSTLAKEVAPRGRGGIVGKTISIGLRGLDTHLKEQAREKRLTGAAVFDEPVPVRYQTALQQRIRNQGKSAKRQPIEYFDPESGE